MSGLDLDAIRERANRAAPLPWHVLSDPDDDGVPERAMGVLAPTRPWGDDDGEVVFEDHDTVRADAEFIAAAREDVPALLAEVDRLRAELARLSPAESRPGVRLYLGPDGPDGAQVVTQYADIADRLGEPGRPLYLRDGAA